MKKRDRLTPEDLMSQMKFLEVMLKKSAEAGLETEQNRASNAVHAIVSEILLNAFVDPKDDFSMVLESKPMQKWRKQVSDGNPVGEYIKYGQILLNEVIRHYDPDEYEKMISSLQKFLKVKIREKDSFDWIFKSALNIGTHRGEVFPKVAWNIVSLMRRGEDALSKWHKYKAEGLIGFPKYIYSDHDEEADTITDFKSWMMKNNVEDELILKVLKDEIRRDVDINAQQEKSASKKFVEMCIDRKNVSMLKCLTEINHPVLRNLRDDFEMPIVAAGNLKDASDAFSYLGDKYSVFIELKNNGVLGNEEMKKWFLEQINLKTIKGDIAALEVVREASDTLVWFKLQKELERFSLQLDSSYVEVQKLASAL